MLINIISKFLRKRLSVSLNQRKEVQKFSPTIFEQKNSDRIFVSVECEPTELLKELMKTDRVLQSKVERIQKEFKIYEYFSSLVPTTFKDKHWIYLLRTCDVIERVRYFWFMGLTEQREINDKEAYEARKAEKIEKAEIDAEKYKKGEMVYGGRGYNLMFTNKSTSEFYFWNAFQLAMQDQMPRLLFDCQFIPDQHPKEYSRVLRSAGHAYYLNLENRMSFPASFINVNESDPNTKNLITKHIVPSGVSSYHQGQRFNPDFYRHDPFHDLQSSNKQMDERDQVIYLSKYASETLKGPLIHKAYIIPLTFDSKKETIGAVRKGRYRTMYFPIREYVKWECGAFKLAFVVQLRILQDVARNGGDWKSAIERNVPIVNRRSLSERKEIIGDEHFNLIVEKRNEKIKINEYIHQSLGRQPEFFEEKYKKKNTEILKEYANRLNYF